jgi:intracellular multiplication protein IcmP
MPPPSAQQPASDNSLAPLWITVGLFILGWLLWSFFHVQIVWFCLQIKAWEAQLIASVLPQLSYLPVKIQHLSPGQVEFSQLMAISHDVGSYLRYPILVVLIVLATIIYFSHINLQFKKKYSMKSLAQAERKNWPQITPVIGLNLVKQDIDKGLWAMALSPMQFAKKHQLLQEKKTLLSTMTMISALRNQSTMEIRRDAAFQVFALQLGEYWQGVDYLPPHTKALFTIFAARANRDRKGSLKLLLQIAESSTGKLDFSGVNELLEKHKNNGAVTRIMQSHAYVLTVMASMLVLARKDGVLAAADFLWLKPKDRLLWFMLNSVGRQTVFPEVAGPFAHWNIECAMGRRLLVPMVEEAVNGLDAAIKEILYIADA